MVNSWSAVSDGGCLIFLVLLAAGTTFKGFMSDLDVPCNEPRFIKQGGLPHSPHGAVGN